MLPMKSVTDYMGCTHCTSDSDTDDDDDTTTNYYYAFMDANVLKHNASAKHWSHHKHFMAAL